MQIEKLWIATFAGGKKGTEHSQLMLKLAELHGVQHLMWLAAGREMEEETEI